MAGLTIGTDKENTRLFFMAVILAGFGLLNLIPFSLGILGTIWPIAPLWAIGAWGRDPPSGKCALILFVVGIIMDVVSASNLGIFAAVYVLAYGGYLIKVRFLGTTAAPQTGDALFLSVIFIVACLIAGIFAKQWPDVISLIAPLAITIAFYPRMMKIFVISGNNNE